MRASRRPARLPRMRRLRCRYFRNPSCDRALSNLWIRRRAPTPPRSRWRGRRPRGESVHTRATRGARSGLWSRVSWSALVLRGAKRGGAGDRDGSRSHTRVGAWASRDRQGRGRTADRSCAHRPGLRNGVINKDLFKKPAPQGVGHRLEAVSPVACREVQTVHCPLPRTAQPFAPSAAVGCNVSRRLTCGPLSWHLTLTRLACRP